MLPADIQVIQRGWLSANQVFLFGNEALDIVDSAFCTHSQQTLQLIHQALTRAPYSSLGKLVNTHLHSDHCGGNAAIQRTHSVAIYIPEAEWDAVNNWDENLLSYRELGQPCPRFTANQILKPNKTIALGNYEWVILAAPGHDPHSIMLFQETLGILISADALWEKGFGAVFPELKGEGGFSEVRASLDLIEQIKPRLVIPGHGQPFDKVTEALKSARSRLAYLENDIKKNALQVCKVLVKFKLLELQTVSQKLALEWVKQTPMFSRVANLLAIDVQELFEQTIQSLEQGHALTLQDNMLINCD